MGVSCSLCLKSQILAKNTTKEYINYTVLYLPLPNEKCFKHQTKALNDVDHFSLDQKTSEPSVLVEGLRPLDRSDFGEITTDLVEWYLFHFWLHTLNSDAVECGCSIFFFNVKQKSPG